MRTHHPHLRLLAVALSLSAVLAAPAAAFTPPTPSTCQTMVAGYWGGGSVWFWDGRLQWQMCVVKTSTGAHYAKLQLSSPVTIDVYDRFTGRVNVWLDGCYPQNQYSTIAQTSRLVSGYDVGTASGGRYYFPTIQTPSSTLLANRGYRIHIQTWVAAVVPRVASAEVIALSPAGLATGPGTDANFYSGCMYV